MVNDGEVKELMAGIGVGCFEFVRLLLFKGTMLGFRIFFSCSIDVDTGMSLEQARGLKSCGVTESLSGVLSFDIFPLIFSEMLKMNWNYLMTYLWYK